MNRAELLDNFLRESEFDCYLDIGATIKEANLYYLTKVKIPDDIVFLRIAGKSIMLTSEMEIQRARKESIVDEVVPTSEYKQGDIRDDKNAKLEVIKNFLNDFDVEKIGLPPYFDLKTAEILREEFELEAVENIVEDQRMQKDEEEIKELRKSQKTTEEVMKKASEIIKDAEVKDGELYWKGENLTSLRLKSELKKFLLDSNYESPNGMIVTCGKESADPHRRESGVLKPEEPIVIDIFPKGNSMYFGDMTRTFVKVDVPDEVKDMEKAVKKALDAAFEMLKEGSGVKANEIHNKVCDTLEDQGYNTLRESDSDTGFLHSTGHAVGLELHEKPRIAGNEDGIKEGMVLTIEPGLYLPDVGGLRLEDMILVKENSYENFNSMSKDVLVE